MAFPVVNPNAAGIDIGDLVIAVAVPGDRDPQPVREFGAFTEDLLSIARWLRECRVDSVAMECTGVYWMNLYAVLVERGFSVCLANSRHTKRLFEISYSRSFSPFLAYFSSETRHMEPPCSSSRTKKRSKMAEK